MATTRASSQSISQPITYRYGKVKDSSCVPLVVRRANALDDHSAGHAEVKQDAGRPTIQRPPKVLPLAVEPGDGAAYQSRLQLFGRAALDDGCGAWVAVAAWYHNVLFSVVQDGIKDGIASIALKPRFIMKHAALYTYGNAAMLRGGRSNVLQFSCTPSRSCWHCVHCFYRHKSTSKALN